jgi:hypothetical protein
MTRQSVKARAINLSPKNVAATPAAARSVEKKGVEAKEVKWGNNNKLPNEIIALVKESPTLRRCLAKIDAFIQADGFSDAEVAAKYQVNPNQTADDLLDQIASDAAIFGGSFALRVKYNLDKQPAEVYYVPLQTVRKLDNGQFLVNHTLGTKSVKKEFDEILDPFNPDLEDDAARARIEEMLAEVEETGEEANQTGQLYFYYRKTGLTPDYPEPEWWAGKEDIETDAQIPKSDRKSVLKNFRPSVIVSITGEISDDDPDEDGKTTLDYTQESIRELTEPDNECEAILINNPIAEGKTTLLPFDSKAQLTAMDPKRATIAEAICRHVGIHSALVFKTAGQLGQSQEVLNLIQMQQSEINPIQRQITRAFTRIFPKDEKGQEIDWTISTLTPIKVVSDSMWQVMTDEEKRNFSGLPEPEESNIAKDTLTVIANLKALPENIQQAVMGVMTAEQLLSFVGLPAPATNENI